MNAEQTTFGDVEVSFPEAFVALCDIKRAPNNFFDTELIEQIADAYEYLDSDGRCRAIVLASQGKNFCAGANFSGPATDTPSEPGDGNPLYEAAVRLFKVSIPTVAAVQGSAVGGGFGLAISADFRVGCETSRFAANFVKLGFTPGFGLTHTLPRIVGEQIALEIFMSGRRLKGEEAHKIGILDRFVEPENLRASAIELASSFAVNAPLAVQTVKQSLRGDLANAVKRATDVEHANQTRLRKTEDFKEGVKAVAERRAGHFVGK